MNHPLSQVDKQQDPVLVLSLLYNNGIVEGHDEILFPSQLWSDWVNFLLTPQAEKEDLRELSSYEMKGLVATIVLHELNEAINDYIWKHFITVTLS